MRCSQKLNGLIRKPICLTLSRDYEAADVLRFKPAEPFDIVICFPGFSVIPAAKLTNDRMNRLAGLLLSSIAIAFLLVAPEQCLAQTQLVPVKVAVPASFRSSPFHRDRYLQVPRGFQIRVV